MFCEFYHEPNDTIHNYTSSHVNPQSSRHLTSFQLTGVLNIT
jgi:hypothetical protein